jgi:hypothetical protein
VLLPCPSCHHLPLLLLLLLLPHLQGGPCAFWACPASWAADEQGLLLLLLLLCCC